MKNGPRTYLLKTRVRVRVIIYDRRRQVDFAVAILLRARVTFFIIIIVNVVDQFVRHSLSVLSNGTRERR